MSDRVLEYGGAPLARVVEGEGPVVAFALHAGSGLRPGLAEHLAIGSDERLREEDPFTARMFPRGVTCVEVLRSRFEVDLNRPRFRAVYQGPQDSWGLKVYRHELPDEMDRVSRAAYDAFYALAFDVLSKVADEHEHFVVLDVHSYNHRRDGADKPAAPEQDNPEVNLGTGRFDRDRWAPVVDAFIGSMASYDLDCRENVKFQGGHLAHWVTDTFQGRGAALAIEFKKTYMDEWSGVPDHGAIDRNRAALEHATTRIIEVLSSIPAMPK